MVGVAVFGLEYATDRVVQFCNLTVKRGRPVILGGENPPFRCSVGDTPGFLQPAHIGYPVRPVEIGCPGSAISSV